MLPTLQDLCPWLFALWLMEGVILVGPLHLVLVSHLGRRFSLKGRGLHLASSLAVSQSFLTHRASVDFTLEGVTVLKNRFPTEAARYERESFEVLPYEDLREAAADGATVRWDDKHEIRLPSAAFASVLVRRVQEFIATDPRQRAEKIESYDAEAFDAEAACRLRDELAGPVTRLQRASTTVFFLLLVIYPALVYSELVTGRLLMVWLVALLCAQFAVLVFGYRLNREMKKRDLEVNQALLPWMLLYPPAAMHGANSLVRDLFQGFDYVAVAVATLPPQQAVRLLRAELYGIRHAQTTSADKSWTDRWECRRRLLVELIERQGWSEDDVLTAPERNDPVAARFCPACHMEYVERAELCSDCQFELVELACRSTKVVRPK